MKKQIPKFVLLMITFLSFSFVIYRDDSPLNSPEVLNTQEYYQEACSCPNFIKARKTTTDTIPIADRNVTHPFDAEYHEITQTDITLTTLSPDSLLLDSLKTKYNTANPNCTITSSSITGKITYITASETRQSTPTSVPVFHSLRLKNLQGSITIETVIVNSVTGETTNCCKVYTPYVKTIKVFGKNMETIDFNEADCPNAKRSLKLMQLNNLENSILIYPNPANNHVTVQSVSNLVKYELMTVDGKLLESKSIDTKQFDINFESYYNGVYYIQLIDNENKVYRNKISIVH